MADFLGFCSTALEAASRTEPGTSDTRARILHSNGKESDSHNAILPVVCDLAGGPWILLGPACDGPWILPVVGVAGFEPTTFRSQSGRATKLRHTPSVRHVGYMQSGSASADLRGRHRTRHRVAAIGCAGSVRDPLRCFTCRRSPDLRCGFAGVAQW